MDLFLIFAADLKRKDFYDERCFKLKDLFYLLEKEDFYEKNVSYGSICHCIVVLAEC